MGKKRLALVKSKTAGREKSRFSGFQLFRFASINFSDEAGSERGPTVTGITTAGVLLSSTVCTHVTLPHCLLTPLPAAAAAAPWSRGPSGRSVL